MVDWIIKLPVAGSRYANASIGKSASVIKVNIPFLLIFPSNKDSRPRGAGYSEQSWLKKMYVVVYSLSLILYILADRRLVSMLGDRTCKISIYPEHFSPQLIFHLGQRLKTSFAVMLLSIVTIFVTLYLSSYCSKK